MLNNKTIINNERGFVLVASLLILLILLVIGIAATTTSTIDMQIATNEKIHQQTFYQADGGTELGIRVTYENSLCINSFGFDKIVPGDPWPADVQRGIGQIGVVDLDFAQVGSAGREVVYYPGAISDSAPHTDLDISNEIVPSAGNDPRQVEGYDRNKRGSGWDRKYTIISQHQGISGSQSSIAVEWRISAGVIDSASSSDCNY